MKMFIPASDLWCRPLVLRRLFSPFPAGDRHRAPLYRQIRRFVPDSFSDLVPDNSAKMRFVKAGDLPAGRAGLDVSQMTPTLAGRPQR
jgi:hypothetical protein